MNAQAELAASGAPCAIVLATPTEAERLAALRLLAAALAEYQGPQMRNATVLRADILDILRSLERQALQFAPNVVHVSAERWQKGKPQ